MPGVMLADMASFNWSHFQTICAKYVRIREIYVFGRHGGGASGLVCLTICYLGDFACLP